MSIGSALMTVGCGGGEDAGKAAKLASDLVECKNQNSALKDELAATKAELAKAKAIVPVPLEGITVQGKMGGGGGAPKPEKEGNVSQDQVVKVVKQNANGFRTCYEHALKRKPDLQFINTVTARFALKNTGVASQVQFSPRTDGEMEHCMASMMEKWKFPQFEGGAVVFELPVSLVVK
jgi:hypothetical protein